ncbi:MAG: HAMP domain-containing histidine kinase [Bacteroidota bacterium]|nr:HAMP domain-containing histidine kinase [Bacteroidota bacterium]
MDVKRTFEVQTKLAFQETITGQHIKTLKLNYFTYADDSTPPGKKLVLLPGQPEDRIRKNEEVRILGTISALRDKIPDSLHLKNVTVVGRSATAVPDTTNHVYLFRNEFLGRKANEKEVKFTVNLDSLKDTLQLPKVISAYELALKRQNMDVPFTILRLPNVLPSGDTPLSVVTVGIAHPVTYQLQLGDTFPYLAKKMAWPFLFSVFLVGITIVSFLLLYKNLLRQRRLAEIKNEFISNITHELKTPIATVGVAIEALKNFNAIHDEQKTKEYLEISTDELKRLSFLVDKVLKLSMFERKELELKPENVNLKEVTQEVITSLRLQIENHHARVDLQSEGNLLLTADRMHLQSAIFNFLDNALKYSLPDPVINIHLSEKENQIEWTITDNGIGISPQYKDKIFEKFFRVPASDIHNAKGHGLGLSYVAQIIELHRGTILVDSRPGEGTTFIITLPKFGQA